MQLSTFRLVAAAVVAIGLGTSARVGGLDRMAVGWHDEFQTDNGWRLEPWQVSTPDDRAAVRFGPDGGVFSVSPNRRMAWTRTTNPIWVEPFSQLVIECTVEGTVPEGFPQLLLTDDSTGPVTPNALNPENPLAGDHEAIVQLRSGVHRYDLAKLFPSDRIARLSLRIAAGEQGASVTIKRLAFVVPDPGTAATPQITAASPGLLPAADPGQATPSIVWRPIELPASRSVSAERLAAAIGCRPDWPDQDDHRIGDVSFQLRLADAAAVATGVMEEESIELIGEWRGGELALLLGSRVFGSDAPWYAATTVRARKAVTSPHQFVVRLAYADGSRAWHFPRTAGGNAAQIGSRPAVYRVPVDAGKTLTSIALVERMSYGQVFLLAASIRNAPGAADTPPVLAAASRPSIPPGITRFEHKDSELRIESGWMRMNCDVSHGVHVKNLSLPPFDRQVVPLDSGSALLELRDAKGNLLSLSLTDVRDGTDAGSPKLGLAYTVGDAADRRTLNVVLAAVGQGAVEISAVLRNGADAAWKPVANMPALRQAAISGEPSDAHYLVGLRNALLSNQNTKIDKPYGAPWPLQVVDLFARRQGGGVGMFIIDPNVLAKRVRFTQIDGKAEAAFCYDYLNLPAGGAVELPPTVILPHLGDWHDAFAAYRERVRQAGLAPAADAPPHALSDTFYCRRDYPLGGTNYLFDIAHRTYTPDTLIDESQRAFGGLDLIDISGWAYNEKTGRVGDYLVNDLGGLTAVRDLAARSHADGKKVGLYFEGFLIDRRCALAARAMPGWQMILENGKPRWWSGDMEFFACPGVKAWQTELAGAMAEVAATTGVDAVYADEFGISSMDRACWSPDHGHPVPSNPLYDEREMLGILRLALKAKAPHTAVYTEYPPADGLAGLVDGAFDIALFDANLGQHPTEMPLHRYVFPHVAIFQMAGHGIRPVPFEADDLHRMVFHGQGPWLKGRGDSWFTTGLRDFAAEAYPMFAQYGPLFRSADCEPLIPTLRPDLYANRFSAGGRTIYTLFNAGHSTISGDLLAIPIDNGGRLTGLIAAPDARLQTRDGHTVLSGSVEPWSTAAVLIER